LKKKKKKKNFWKKEKTKGKPIGFKKK